MRSKYSLVVKSILSRARGHFIQFKTAESAKSSPAHIYFILCCFFRFYFLFFFFAPMPQAYLTAAQRLNTSLNIYFLRVIWRALPRVFICPFSLYSLAQPMLKTFEHVCMYIHKSHTHGGSPRVKEHFKLAILTRNANLPLYFILYKDRHTRILQDRIIY